MKQIISVAAAAILVTAQGFPDELSAPDQRLVGLWLMGQSLCEGAESLPVVTPTDSGWGNYRFRRGVRTWIHGRHGDRPELRPDEQFALVPLSATKYGGLGETIASGLADHLRARALNSQSTSSDPIPEAPHYLAAYAGQGGRFIDELSHVDQTTDPRTPASRQHGGGYYQTSLDDARRAVQHAQASHLTFTIAALVWMQGEANAGPTGGIRPSRWDDELARPQGQEWYRDRLIDYRKRWSRDLQSITGQTTDIPMFTYQTLSAAGEAQLMAADLDPDITMVGPHYMVPSAVNSRYAGRYGDPIHLSADGERWYGEQVAKVIGRVLTEGEAWEPLRPRKAWIAADRTSVLVDFQVPRPPIVLDDTFLPRQEYSRDKGFHSLNGFQVHSSTGTVMAISAVVVESPTRIRVRLAAPLNADEQPTLSYGLPYAGRLGSIVDIRRGSMFRNQPTTELVLDSNIAEQLKPLTAEGAFFVSNMLPGDSHTRVPVRHISTDGESTVLRFEDRERRDKVDFVIGQQLTALRSFSYGNVRDSDNEAAIYRFADSEYGTRAGRSYPLWNWCVLFREFPIAER